MAFFTQFPKIQYDIEENNQPSLIHNIFRHVDVTTVNTDDFTTYTFYEVQDGDRPDIISQRLYGTPHYYWTFFIINDFLQAGFNEFYKSYQNLQRGLEIEYTPYGTLIFTQENSSFNGIDVTYDNLRIKRLGTPTEPVAKIERWDPNMMQLITYEPTIASSFYFESQSSIPQYALQFADTSSTTVAANQEWIDEFNEVMEVRGFAPVTINTLNTIAFTASDIYASLINAPWRYVAQTTIPGIVNEGDELYAYDALVKQYGSSNGGDFISNFTHELDKNENNRKIRVVNPLYINEFANEYRRLINL